MASRFVARPGAELLCWIILFLLLYLAPQICQNSFAGRGVPCALSLKNLGRFSR